MGNSREKNRKFWSKKCHPKSWYNLEKSMKWNATKVKSGADWHQQSVWTFRPMPRCCVHIRFFETEGKNEENCLFSQGRVQFQNGERLGQIAILQFQRKWSHPRLFAQLISQANIRNYRGIQLSVIFFRVWKKLIWFYIQHARWFFTLLYPASMESSSVSSTQNTSWIIWFNTQHAKGTMWNAKA